MQKKSLHHYGAFNGEFGTEKSMQNDQFIFSKDKSIWPCSILSAYIAIKQCSPILFTIVQRGEKMIAYPQSLG